MKKSFLVLMFLLITAAIVGCSFGSNAKKIKVGAMSGPNVEVLKEVKRIMSAENGIDLEIVEFDNYDQPNHALHDKEIDVNFFQHIVFLKNFLSTHKNIDLVDVADVFIMPMRIYSHKYTSLSELPEGATIAVPNDPTNGGRALLLLEKAGLIKLREGISDKATVYDVISSPKRIKFQTVAPEQVIDFLDDVDAAVSNTSFAMQAGFAPAEDSLFSENTTSPYVLVVAVRRGDEDLPKIQALVQAIQSDAVRTFINDKYKGSVIPAF